MNSGKDRKIRNTIPMIATYRIIKVVDNWGKKPKREQYGKGIEIRNRNKEIFDWYIGEQEEQSVLVEEEGRSNNSELAA